MPHSQSFEFRSAREATPIQVVGDAAIATASVSEGRLVPLLIVDASSRPELEALIQAHKTLPPGDASHQWGQRNKKDDSIILILEFERPVVLKVMIEFKIASQGVLVDLMLRSRGFYLQVGRKGDRFLTTQDHPRLFMDAPLTGFEEVWDGLFLDHLAKDLQKRGLNRANAKAAAAQYLAQLRRMSGGRVRSGS